MNLFFILVAGLFQTKVAKLTDYALSVVAKEIFFYKSPLKVSLRCVRLECQVPMNIMKNDFF